MKNAKTLFMLLALAAMIGAVVMTINRNYRRPYNLVTNRNFYSLLMER
jgi:hypothetical protein